MYVDHNINRKLSKKYW